MLSQDLCLCVEKWWKDRDEANVEKDSTNASEGSLLPFHPEEDVPRAAPSAIFCSAGEGCCNKYGCAVTLGVRLKMEVGKLHVILGVGKRENAKIALFNSSWSLHKNSFVLALLLQGRLWGNHNYTKTVSMRRIQGEHHLGNHLWIATGRKARFCFYASLVILTGCLQQWIWTISYTERWSSNFHWKKARTGYANRSVC